jgi:xanthine dehydrogenase accessory factor
MNWPAIPHLQAAAAAAPATAAPAAAEWLRPLRDWPRAALQALEREPVVVRIVVTGVLGSAPRDAGVCMLVGEHRFEGTVGGGQLEWQALAAARTLLAGATPAARTQRLVLGTDLGQCCGGVVELWMERYTRADRAVLRTAREAAGRDAAVLISTITAGGINHRIVIACGYSPEADLLLRTPRASALPRVIGSAGTDTGGTSLLERLDEAMPAVWLYGAGHVGQALVRIAAELPLRLTWIDTRAGSFPAQVPDMVRIVHAPDPLPGVAAAAAGTRFLVLTHSHALDYALCRAILERGDFASLGVIGSDSKGARFRSRLARDGVPAEAIARLRCPIGTGGVASKWPAAIAVAVAFELLCTIGNDAEQGHAAAAPPAEAGCAAAGCANCHAPDHSC